MNVSRAIVAGTLVWVLLIFAFISSASIQILKNAELQENLTIAFFLIPAAYLGARFYYSSGNSTHGLLLGAVMASIAIIADGLITVPFFIIPMGGSYGQFFSNPAFWWIIAEYLILVFAFWKLKSSK